MKRILACCDGLAAGKDGILLVERRFMPFKGFWALPGGIVEENESLEEAVRREFKEETGLKVKVNKMVDARIEEHPHERRVIITFHVTIQNGVLTKCEEHSKIGFFKSPPGKLIADYFEIAERI